MENHYAESATQKLCFGLPPTHQYKRLGLHFIFSLPGNPVAANGVFPAIWQRPPSPPPPNSRAPVQGCRSSHVYALPE